MWKVYNFTIAREQRAFQLSLNVWCTCDFAALFLSTSWRAVKNEEKRAEKKRKRRTGHDTECVLLCTYSYSKPPILWAPRLYTIITSLITILCTRVHTCTFSQIYKTISNNFWNDFTRRCKSIQTFVRFLFRFISVLVPRTVLSDAFFRVLRVLAPSFFVFFLLLLSFGVRNADEVVFEILHVVSHRTICIDSWYELRFWRSIRRIHSNVHVLVTN